MLILSRAVATLLLWAVVGSAPAFAAGTAAPVAETSQFSLASALAMAEAHNQNLRLARYQVQSVRANLSSAPTSAAALAPLAALYAQAQLGVSIPPASISPEVATRQAKINYEQAVVSLYRARQQVRMAVLQSYVEWQRALALVLAQEGALERAVSQKEQVRKAVEVGAVARFDLLQAETQVAIQRAALTGAFAAAESAWQSLQSLIGRPLGRDLVPSEELAHSAEVEMPEDLETMVARALQRRPDLRQLQLDLHAMRLQASLVTPGDVALVLLQTQSTAVQYEAGRIRVQAEVQQALARVQMSLQELRARESAMEPAKESLRLAELRFSAGLGTYLEVQTASVSLLQAEAARIHSAADLRLNLARLAQSQGDL